MNIKSIIALFICFTGCILPTFIYAADDVSTPSALNYDDYLTVYVENLNDYSDMNLESVNVSNQRISANDTNGLKSIMLSLIGDYETTVTDYVYNNGSYQSHSINVERDWSWILSCCLFIVVVYCTFRAVGGILWK